MRVREESRWRVALVASAIGLAGANIFALCHTARGLTAVSRIEDDEI